MKSHLQIKYNSLSAEMRIIHRKEIKWKKRARAARQKGRDTSYQETNFWSLRGHREKLKVEARITHLAQGFLRFNNSYFDMERLTYTAPDWDAIQSMVERFSKDEPAKPTDNESVMQRFATWRAAAEAYCEQSMDEAKDRLNIPRVKGEHKQGDRAAFEATQGQEAIG